jgi:tetratricopeptide (TPR) repeat protein
MLRRILTALASAFGVLLSAVLVDPAKDFIKGLVKQHHFLEQAWSHISGHPFWLGLGVVVLALAAVADWFINPSEPRDAKQSSSITGGGNTVIQAESGAKTNVGSHNVTDSQNVSGSGQVAINWPNTNQTSKRAERDFIEHYHEAQRAERVVPMQIAPPPPDFTGRNELFAELVSTLRGGGNASITGISGMGGIGKTALAQAVAAELKPDFPDGQIYLDLKGAPHERDAPDTQPLSLIDAVTHVISSYGHEIPANTTIELRQAFCRSILHGKRALLLMDNARDAAQVDPLRPPASCAMVVTSRQDFVLDWLELRHLDVLKPDKARALLLEIEPRIELHAFEFARLCGYLPLALRTIASTLKIRRDLSPEALLRKMANVAELLRASGVMLALSTSADLLPATLRQLWYQLGVFPATFDEPAAAAVWQRDASTTNDALGELLRSNLVEFDTTKRRYRLHDLVRHFAFARLDAASRSTSQVRHALHYRGVSAATDPLYEGGGVMGNLGLDRPDILKYQKAIQIDEQRLIIARERGDRRREGEALGNLGTANYALGEYRRAIELHQQRLMIAREIRDLRGEGDALGQLGVVYSALDEYRRAIEFHQQSLAIAREIDDPRGEGDALGELGSAYLSLGEYRHAIELHQQRLMIAREIGDLRGEGDALGQLGVAYSALDEYRRAIEFQEQYLIIARELGDHRREGIALGNLGNTYYALGEYRRAIEFHEQYLVIARELGDRGGEGIALLDSASALGKMGNRDEAIRRTQAALEIFEQIESPHAERARQQLAKLRSGS